MVGTLFCLSSLTPILFSFWISFVSQIVNPVALRTAKTPWSFGCSECNRVKVNVYAFIAFHACFEKKMDILCHGVVCPLVCKHSYACNIS